LGVVLATGGLAANREWRDKLTGRAIPHTNAYDVASGDGVDAGMAAGAAFDKGRGTPFWWIPSSTIRWPDGRIATYPHIRDRPKPGLIAVNGKGQRFVNEASSYHDFGLAQLAASPEDKAIPTWLVCDRAFVHNYGLGVIHPVWQRVSFFEKIGYVISASTLDELARKIGVDAKALAESVAQNNRAAVTGTDEAFGKGSMAINRRDGDPEHKGPNMCVGPIEKAPFFAVPVYPAPIGSCAGLRSNGDAQVLDEQDQPIAGLYAAGNDMASVMDGTYPGPGATLGPALVFGYRAAMHAKQKSAAPAASLRNARDVEPAVAGVSW
jgi:succinate dehydrogenase/fumarate reductase flavoprotein subunit